MSSKDLKVIWQGSLIIVVISDYSRRGSTFKLEKIIIRNVVIIYRRWKYMVRVTDQLNAVRISNQVVLRV